MRKTFVLSKAIRLSVAASVLLVLLLFYGVSSVGAIEVVDPPPIVPTVTAAPPPFDPTTTVTVTETATTTLPEVTATVTVTATPTTTITTKLPNTKASGLHKATQRVLPRPKASTVTVYRTHAFFMPQSTVTMPGDRQTMTVYATVDPETSTTTNTAVKHVKGDVIERVVTLTRTKFIGYSLLLFILGIAAAVLFSWLSFIYGWKSGDAGNRDFLREVRDNLIYKDDYTPKHR